jgi:hypothetical protein
MLDEGNLESRISLKYCQNPLIHRRNTPAFCKNPPQSRGRLLCATGGRSEAMAILFNDGNRQK